ncbi:hypothetical protein BGZ94_007774 [Podila epigama]|nr:hypothetical protein BGZ94_007774 [Podila epigama]
MDLSDNKIEVIDAPEDTDDFKTLNTLRFNGNIAQDWLSFDRLGMYPSLKTLWVGPNPVKPPSNNPAAAVEPRIIIIAKMEHLEHLNGSEVQKRHRLDAELYYQKHVALTTVGMEDSAVNALHPRFEKLCQLHGPPDVSEESRKATSDVLKDRLVAVTLATKVGKNGPPQTTIQRNVLGTMTVKNLKNLIQKLFKIPAMRQELSFEIVDPDYDDKKITVELKDDMRQLSYYDIHDGVEIMIKDKGKKL